MKIAIVSDLHIGYERFRKDAYAQAKEALEMACSMSDAIIIPGDIFDTRFPKPEVIAEAMDIFMNIPTDGLKAKILDFSGEKAVHTSVPVLAIPGTHERRTDDVEDPVDLLNLAAMLADIGMGIAVLQKGGEKVAVTGIAGVAEERFMDALKEHAAGPVEGVFNILVFHQSLYELLPFNDSFLKMNELPKGFDLYVDGHMHNKIESRVHGKPFLIPGSTVLTQLKSVETGEKGFFVFDTVNGSYEFVHINSRNFEVIKADADSLGEGALLSSIETKADEIISRCGKGCVIKIEITGSGKAMKKLGMGLQELVKKLKGDAVIEVAKKGLDSMEEGKRAEVHSEIGNVSIRDLGIEILSSELKKSGYDFSIKPEELFELLSSGEKKDKVVANAIKKLIG